MLPAPVRIIAFVLPEGPSGSVSRASARDSYTARQRSGSARIIGVNGRLRRRWALSPLPGPGAIRSNEGVTLRPTAPADDRALAALLQRCYLGTIDFDADHDFQKELLTWRSVDYADDEASTVAVSDGELIGMCLIAHELGSPLVYEVAVAPERRRAGVGRHLLVTSLTNLAERRAEMVAAWVTLGNFASEALLGSAGFVPVGQPLGASAGVAYYRAALAIEQIDVANAVALATDRPKMAAQYCGWSRTIPTTPSRWPLEGRPSGCYGSGPTMPELPTWLGGRCPSPGRHGFLLGRTRRSRRSPVQLTNCPGQNKPYAPRF